MNRNSLQSVSLMKNTRSYVLLFVLAILNCCFGYYVGVTHNPFVDPSSIVIPHKDLRLRFTGVSRDYSGARFASIGKQREIDISHVKFEFLGQRLYQFYYDRKIGYILTYKISTTDPKRPLAHTSDVEWDECGKVLKGKSHDLELRIDVDDPQWTFSFADGRNTEHWHDNGEIMCVSSVDFYTNRVSTWDDRSYKDTITIATELMDGIMWTGKPREPLPLHSVVVDFYVKPVHPIISEYVGQ